MIPSMLIGVEPVAKLGPPKVHLQTLTGYEQNGNTTTRHEPDKLETHYRGKSAILRRPKYQAVAYPRRLEDRRGYDGYMAVSPNQRVTTENARRIAAAHEGRTRRVTLHNSAEGRENPSVAHVSKAFSSERQRHRREGLYEGGLAGGSVASGLTARQRYGRAAVLRDASQVSAKEAKGHLVDASRRLGRLSGLTAPIGERARTSAARANESVGHASQSVLASERDARKAAWAARQSKGAAAGAAAMAGGAYLLHRRDAG